MSDRRPPAHAERATSLRQGFLATLAGLVVALATAAGVATGQTRYPIFTLDNFVSTMKTVGRNFTGLNQSLAKNDFETAKAQLARSRELLAITITFWRDRKNEDAIRMLRDVLTRIDALDAALSVENVDPTGVTASARQLGAACQTCHAAYREQDPVTKAYRVKLGITE